MTVSVHRSRGLYAAADVCLNEETYENFWELFGTIPSLRQPGHSVTEEILEFDHAPSYLRQGKAGG